MKKSIVAMLSITALATVANAETLHTGTDFEGTTGTNLFWATHNDSGNQDGETFYWYATNYVEQSSVDQSLGVYTNENIGAENENRYLSLDTEGNRVYRTIASRHPFTVPPQPQQVSSTLYFDSLVQFTVNEDDEPTMQEGDKLAVWLQGGETTNLVVTAGYLSGGEVTRTNYVVQTTDQIVPGNWYRLTIEASPLINYASPDKGYLGFRVRIDGDYVTTAANIKGSVQDVIDGWAEKATGDMENAVLITDEAGLFPSLVKGGNGVIGCDTLACVGFEGTGAIDNLLFTDADPIQPVGPSNPTVDGVEVDATNVFITARSNKPIVYPTAPTITTNGEGVVSIGFAGTSVNVPEWYDVSSTDGLTVNLTLNDNALPTIGEATVDGDDKAAIEVDDANDKFLATLTRTIPSLYYGLKVASAPNAAEADWTSGTLTQGTGAAMQISADKPTVSGDPAPAGFFKLYVTDVAPTPAPAPEPGE